MADQHLSIRPVPLLAPRQGAVEQIRDRAARLRIRRLRAAVATAGVTATLATVLAWHPNATWHSLEPARVPWSPSPSTPAEAESVPLSVGRPAGTPVPTRHPLPRPTTPLVLEPEVYPQPWYPSWQDQALQATAFGPDMINPPDGWLCANPLTEWSEGPEGWCLSLFASGPGQSDPNAWYFGARVCRMARSGTATFANDHLPRLRIYDADDDALVFDSALRPWPAAGDARPSKSWQVEERGCLMFMSPWMSIDSNGDPVPGGKFRYDWDPTDADFDVWATAHTGGEIDVPDE